MPTLTLNKPKSPYKSNGLFYYPELPANMRRATISDFFTAMNDIRPGIDFLVKGTENPEYEAHRTSDTDHFVKWMDWVPAGRVFVSNSF